MKYSAHTRKNEPRQVLPPKTPEPERSFAEQTIREVTSLWDRTTMETHLVRLAYRQYDLATMKPQLAAALATRWDNQSCFPHKPSLDFLARSIRDLGPSSQPLVDRLITHLNDHHGTDEKGILGEAIIAAGTSQQIITSVPPTLRSMYYHGSDNLLFEERAHLMGQKLQRRLTEDLAPERHQVITALRAAEPLNVSHLPSFCFEQSEGWTSHGSLMGMLLLGAEDDGPQAQRWAQAMAQGRRPPRDGCDTFTSARIMAVNVPRLLTWLNSQVDNGRSGSLRQDPILYESVACMAIGGESPGKIRHALSPSQHDQACAIFSALTNAV